MKRTLTLDAARRYLSLKSHTLHALPIAILMPHSSCNCRCVMCDIWQGNANVQQLNEADIDRMIADFQALGTQWVVFSGGEALMNRNLFFLCDKLQAAGLKITILSTGLLLAKFAADVVAKTDEVIVSLDGSAAVHDSIRRVPRAFDRLREGVAAVKALDPTYRIGGRCVIQRLNFADWPNIVTAAHTLGLDEISFLAADVSSEAFNRPEMWDAGRTEEVRLEAEQIPALTAVVEQLIEQFGADFASGFIAESPAKLRRIVDYYAALVGQGAFPAVKCNAPWVSTVVEADGTVRPCFFHPPLGNIRETPLKTLLNSETAVAFRRQLDLDRDPICRKCVCSLNLRPTVKLT